MTNCHGLTQCPVTWTTISWSTSMCTLFVELRFLHHCPTKTSYKAQRDRATFYVRYLPSPDIDYVWCALCNICFTILWVSMCPTSQQRQNCPMEEQTPNTADVPFTYYYSTIHIGSNVSDIYCTQKHTSFHKPYGAFIISDECWWKK